MKVWLITGASSGFGRLLAQAVLERGDYVAMTSRDPARMADLVDAFPDRAAAYRMDVADTADVYAATAQIEARFGRVDVLVNNAGYALIAAVEEASETQYRALFDIDLFGPVAVMRAVLPGMRARRSGRIINISSMAALAGSMGLGYYAAAKSALGLLSESLAAEVAGLGIIVVVVEPGAHGTSVRENSVFGEALIEDYVETAGRNRRLLMETKGAEPGDATLAAQAILLIAEEAAPPLHLPLGDDALNRVKSVIRSQEDILRRWETVIRSTWPHAQ